MRGLGLGFGLGQMLRLRLGFRQDSTAWKQSKKIFIACSLSSLGSCHFGTISSALCLLDFHLGSVVSALLPSRLPA